MGYLTVANADLQCFRRTVLHIVTFHRTIVILSALFAQICSVNFINRYPCFAFELGVERLGLGLGFRCRHDGCCCCCPSSVSVLAFVVDDENGGCERVRLINNLTCTVSHHRLSQFGGCKMEGSAVFLLVFLVLLSVSRAFFLVNSRDYRRRSWGADGRPETCSNTPNSIRRGGHGDSHCSDEDLDNNDKLDYSEERRRLLAAALSVPSWWVFDDDANAVDVPPNLFDFFRGGRNDIADARSTSLFALSPRRNTTTVRRPLIDAKLLAFEDLSSELCLLRLLPVKSAFFRELQSTIEGISLLRVSEDPKTWAELNTTLTIKGIAELDKKRYLLEPVFNPEEDSAMQITKGERFEVLIETLRDRLIDMQTATMELNATATLIQQKLALLTLSEIGELLVAKFPYDVPTEGKFSYLPRLLGRCRVTFSFRRGKNQMLGNLTMIADGYSAPVTAGNFVDLAARGFYTGLPVKFTKKRLGSSLGGPDFEVANLPILGSFNDGFYDPLTAKPRRLPLELIRVEKVSGEPDLTYAGSSTLNISGSKVEAVSNSKPLLSFKIPGLVAMNHPDQKVNSASSEFFSLQQASMMDEKRTLLDGEYAPFGYIIEGMDVFEKLRAGDVIADSRVSEFGFNTLVKLRRSSFSEVVQGSSTDTGGAEKTAPEESGE